MCYNIIGFYIPEYISGEDIMNEHGISKAELKKLNRECILRTIWESGPISRVDIARKLQITRGAITILTNEMIDQNLIKEVADSGEGATQQPQKGRRKIMLDINYSGFFVLGAAIDNVNISVGLTTIEGRALEKTNISISSDCTPEMAAALIRDASQSILNHSGMDINGIVAFGIGILPDSWVFDDMRCDDGFDRQRVEELFSKYFDIPVYYDDGIRLLSYVCFRGIEGGRDIANRVLLYADKEYFGMSVVCGNILRNKYLTTTSSCNAMRVKLGGEYLEGYCRGSVAAELTPSAVGRKVSGMYGSETTPELYRMTDGDCSAVTIGQLIDACAAGDTVLEPLCSEILDLFCLMLNNIAVLYGADRISLCRFGFNQNNIHRLIKKAEETGDTALAKMIRPCVIDRQHGFICGCINAVINGFYRTGGIIRQNCE